MSTAPSEQHWDAALSDLLDRGVLTGYALITSQGTLEVVCGDLQGEFHGPEPGQLPESCKQFLGLFPGEPDEPPQLSLFGEALVTFQKTERAVYALSHGRKVGVCVNNLPFGVLLSTFRKPSLPQAVVPQLEKALDGLRR